MKNRFLILLFSYFLLFNACMVDNFEENSFLLDSITEVRLSSSDTLFIKKDGSFEVKYALRYFSKQGEVSLKNTVKPKLLLNGTAVEKAEIDLRNEATHTIQVEFPNKSKILSNEQNIRVLSIPNAVTSIKIEPKGGANVLVPELEDPAFDDLFRIELGLLTGEKLIVNQSFLDFKFIINGQTKDDFQVREFEIGKDAAVQIAFNNIASNALTLEILSIREAIAEIELKTLNNISQINTAEIQGKLTDFVAITATLKNAMEIDLKLYPEIFSLEYNEKKLTNFDVKTLPDGKFKLRVAVGEVFSNAVDFEVFDPMTYIKDIELTLDERTRNPYAVAGSSELDFSYRVIGMDNTLLNIPATLIVEGQKQNSFQKVPIGKAGTVSIYAEISGKKSNTVQVTSRQDKVLEKIRVPVVFHVLDNLNKAITREIVEFEIEQLNQAFANVFFPSLTRSSNAVDIYMEFFLVDKEPSGSLMAERGINKFESNGQTFGDFTGEEREYLYRRMWDPRRYVNVFVGRMDRWGGYAYFPILKGIELPGITTVYGTPTLTFPYVTVMSDNAMGRVNGSTLAHEIGHMLGLYHTFDRTGQGQACFDGDYCLDTETHLIDASNSFFTSSGNIQKNCEKENFYSANIMDYISKSNSFTYDQRERMRTAAVFGPFFAKEANYLGGRLSPFERGKIDHSIKPQFCANPHHFGRKYHHAH